jgi:hypothetical protein
LDSIPVFARAGAIVPMGPFSAWGGLDNPSELTIHIFPGADNHFDLYEDDGCSNAYLNGNHTVTSFILTWESQQQTFIIGAAQGNIGLIPAMRNYTIIFHAIHEPQAVDLLLNNKPHCPQVLYSQTQHTLKIDGLTLQPDDRIEVKLRTRPQRVDCRADSVQTMLLAFQLGTDTKYAINLVLEQILDQPTLLETFQSGLTKSHIRALVEVIAGCGAEHIQQAGEELLVLWNRLTDKAFRYSITTEDYEGWDPFTKFSLEKDQVKDSHIYKPARDFTKATQVTVFYGDLFKTVLTFGMDDTYPHPKNGLV